MSVEESRSRHETRVQLSALVPEAFELADKIVGEAMEREERRGSKVSCSEGCANCCRFLVCLSIPEALYIYERLFEAERPWRDEILYRFRQVNEILKQNGLAEALERDFVCQPGDVSYDHRLQLLSRRYFTLDLACPFLDDKACSIYSWRPITCRQYVVTSPAGWCTDPFCNNVRRVSLPLNVTDLLARVTADATEEPSKMIALPLALNWASENQELAKVGVRLDF